MSVGELYKHFKGNTYRVIAKGKHTETLDDVVVYQDVSNGTVWVRPANMFYDYIDTPEYKGFRFIPIK